MRTAILVATMLCGATSAWSWSFSVAGSGDDFGGSVALSRAGGVVLSGQVDGAGNYDTWAVARLDRRGLLRWQQRLAEGCAAGGLALPDPHGDVIAGGEAADTCGEPFRAVLAKLDRTTGATRWRVDPGQSIARAAINRAADVFVVGSADSDTGPRFAVTKVAGNDGHILWSQPVGLGVADRLAVDPAGDVVAAGAFGDPLAAHDFAVVKLAGTTGAVRWERTVVGAGAGGGRAWAVGIGANGDVFAGGATSGHGTDLDFTVVALTGDNGSLRWRTAVAGTADALEFEETANDLAVDPRGAVVAAGSLFNAGTEEDFTVVALDAATGAERWRNVIDGPNHHSDAAVGVAVDPHGNVVAAGYTQGNGPADHGLTVVKCDRDTGAVRWDRRFEGTAHTDRGDLAEALTVDGRGRVFVTGTLDDQGTGADLVAFRLGPGSGHP